MADVAAAVRAAMETQVASMDNLAAAFGWAVYDYALTFSDESRPIHTGSLLFFWVRYFGLGSMIFKLAVTASTTPAMLGELNGPPVKAASGELLSFILVFSVQVILQTRVNALYKSKFVAYLNGAIFAACIFATLSLWALSRPFKCAYVQLGIARKSGCQQGYPLYWIPTAVFEGWIGALAIYKFIKRLRTSRLKLEGPDILTVFLRDSVVHYISVILGVVIFNLLGGHGAPANSGFLQASVFIGGSRLVLHLRRAFFVQQERKYISTIESALVFRRETRMSTFVDEAFWADDDSDDRRRQRRDHAVQLTEM